MPNITTVLEFWKRKNSNTQMLFVDTVFEFRKPKNYENSNFEDAKTLNAQYHHSFGVSKTKQIKKLYFCKRKNTKSSSFENAKTLNAHVCRSWVLELENSKDSKTRVLKTQKRKIPTRTAAFSFADPKT